MIGLLDTTFQVRFRFYRARVVDNKDDKKLGRVRVFIPDLMIGLDEFSDGIWAYPANSPFGGGNTECDPKIADSGSLYVPQVKQWVWVFFENDNPNRPYYLSALYIENRKVPPETQRGSQWYNKWLLFRSPDGRTMWISDYPDDQGVHITGKKRKYNPKSPLDSVIPIKGNQSVVRIDERDGKEKILIADYRNNFVMLDTQHSKAYFHVDNETGTGQINIYTDQTLVVLDDSGYVKIQAPQATVEINNGQIKISASGDIHLKAGGNINLDGSMINLNCGMSQNASPNQIPNIDIDGV